MRPLPQPVPHHRPPTANSAAIYLPMIDMHMDEIPPGISLLTLNLAAAHLFTVRESGTSRLRDRYRQQYSRNHFPCSRFFCRGFFPSVQRERLKSRAEPPQRGQANGTVSNREFLWDRSFLSEIGSALASRILDWTGSAGLSTYGDCARIAILFRPKDARCIKSAARDNRCARVLATPKPVTIPSAKGCQSGKTK